MKQLLITIAAVLVVGCGLWGPSEAERALVGAAESGNIEAVKQHIADGADVNAKGKYGWAPLHYASDGEGKKNVVELLIANDADVNAKDNAGTTPLDWASGKMADLLRKQGGKTGRELKAEGK